MFTKKISLKIHHRASALSIYFCNSVHTAVHNYKYIHIQLYIYCMYEYDMMNTYRYNLSCVYCAISPSTPTD